ncbi:MAG: YafY family transcriptional regulator [candidate division Zixibacteria bacterium]|nr:YafY family transcriptional regulator [candidate division Zixibacteria bacterium]
MKKISRLLYMITLIDSSPGISIDRLSNKCGVSVRTVYRDIIDISEANIPIYYDKGYYILDTGKVPPLSFGKDELIYLFNVLQGKSTGKALDEVKNRLAVKIKSHIPEILKNAKIDFQPRSSDTPDIAKIFSKIEKTIDSEKVVSFDYTSLNGKTSRRHVHPYGLVFRQHGWYLVGFCERREEVRLFRLVRIKNLKVLSKKFNRLKGFSLREYMDESWGIFRGEEYHFKIKFSGPAAVAISSTNHHKNEKIKNIGNNQILYSVVSRGKEDIVNWVLAYGLNAELIEPVEIRKEIKERLKGTLKKYM